MGENMETYQSIIKRFCLPDGTPEISGNFSGNINTTLRLDYPEGSYILQKINLVVFPRYDELMKNIRRVTDHVNRKNKKGMKIIPAKDGKPYAVVGEDCYRVYTYVENSVSFDIAESMEMLQKAGSGFGKFQNDLDDFPADELFEVIPDFHNTEKRLADFKDAVAKDIAGRAGEVQDEIAFLLENEPLASVICRPLREGKLPLRVTHNDTKLNNILFDKDTLEPICAIDLDTVMSGSVLYDYGDAVRYGANKEGEITENIDAVALDLGLFRAFSYGFLEQTKTVLTAQEIALLPESVAVMTYELALRFLEDYLRGDVYFGEAFKGINLLRARVQIKLLKDVLKKLPQMRMILTEYLD